MSLIWRMDKQILLPSYNGILFINQKKQSMMPIATWMTLKCIMLSERSQAQRTT